MDKIKHILIALSLVSLPIVAGAAPTSTITQHLIPQVTDTYDVGSTALKYRNLYGSGSLTLSSLATSSGACVKSDASGTLTLGSCSTGGVSSILAGTGISVSGTSTVTVTNTGVTSFNGATGTISFNGTTGTGTAGYIPYWINTSTLSSTSTIGIQGGTNYIYDPNPSASSSFIVLSSGQLLDTAGGEAVNWAQRYLSDGSIQAINWGNRGLLDNTNNTTLDWQNKLLYDNSAHQTVDWANRLLTRSNSNNTLDWENMVLQDSGGTPTINWGVSNAIQFPQYTTNGILSVGNGSGNVQLASDGTEYWSPTTLSSVSQLTNDAGYLSSSTGAAYFAASTTVSSQWTSSSSGMIYYGGGGVGIGTSDALHSIFQVSGAISTGNDITGTLGQVDFYDTNNGTWHTIAMDGADNMQFSANSIFQGSLTSNGVAYLNAGVIASDFNQYGAGAAHFYGAVTVDGTTTLGSLNGLLKATAGAVEVATAGVDYTTTTVQGVLNSISGTAPISFSTSTGAISFVNPGYITTSTGLTTANFTTNTISQWVNDSGYITSTLASSTWLKTANNLSDLANTSTARTQIGFSAGTNITISSTGTISATASGGSTAINGITTSTYTFNSTSTVPNLNPTGWFTTSTLANGTGVISFNEFPLTYPGRPWFVTANSGAATVSTVGLAAGAVVSATAANVDTVDGAFINVQTGATTSAATASSGVSTAFTIFRDSWGLQGDALIKTSSTVSSNVLWVGFMGASQTSTATSGTKIAFKYDSAIDGTTWRAFVANSSTQYTANTGITVSTGTIYHFGIQANSSTAWFYASTGTNPVSFVTSTTSSLPTSTATNLGFAVRVWNTTSTPSALLFNRMGGTSW